MVLNKQLLRVFLRVLALSFSLLIETGLFNLHLDPNFCHFIFCLHWSLPHRKKNLICLVLCLFLIESNAFFNHRRAGLVLSWLIFYLKFIREWKTGLISVGLVLNYQVFLRGRNTGLICKVPGISQRHKIILMRDFLLHLIDPFSVFLAGERGIVS